MPLLRMVDRLPLMLAANRLSCRNLRWNHRRLGGRQCCLRRNAGLQILIAFRCAASIGLRTARLRTRTVGLRTGIHWVCRRLRNRRFLGRRASRFHYNRLCLGRSLGFQWLCHRWFRRFCRRFCRSFRLFLPARGARCSTQNHRQHQQNRKYKNQDYFLCAHRFSSLPLSLFRFQYTTQIWKQLYRKGNKIHLLSLDISLSLWSNSVLPFPGHLEQRQHHGSTSKANAQQNLPECAACRREPEHVVVHHLIGSLEFILRQQLFH